VLYVSLKMKHRTLATSILLLGLVLLVQSLSGQAVAPPAVQKNAVNQQNKPKSLVVDIQLVKGKKTARFTNNTKNKHGVLLGDKKLLLKPGDSSSLLMPKAEKLKIYDFVKDGKKMKSRMRFMTILLPRIGNFELFKPKKNHESKCTVP